MKATYLYTGDDEWGDDISVIVGGIPTSMVWDEYVKQMWDGDEEAIEAIRKAVLENDLRGKCADEVCNDHLFHLSDGRKIAFTWRAWGDLMAALIGGGETYMAYYASGKSWGKI